MLKKLLKFVAFAFVLSLSACSSLSDKDSDGKDWAAAKLYAFAVEEMESGNYESAVKHFEKLESSYPFGVYAQQAQMDIAYVYYRQHDEVQALAAADRFIKLHPNHPKIDYVYYLRGLINFNDRSSIVDFIAGQDPSERDPKAARDSFDSFKELVTRFPNSIYTPDATARMKYLVNTLAQYEIHVARYYYRRNAFVAAVNRAQSVVKEYRQTPSVEEALFIMARSYDALNLPDLRDDAERVLRKNFPDSVYFKGGPARDSHWWQIW